MVAHWEIHNNLMILNMEVFMIKKKSMKKMFIAITCVVMCAILVVGTFAWTNFDSSIINQFFGRGTSLDPQRAPGGTLHNDFEDGKDYRDIYPENWGSEPLIVRIRLSEYMEIGVGAGTIDNPEKNQAISIIDGATICDVESWEPFSGNLENVIRLESNEGKCFRDYWKWTMGGHKIFSPAPYDLRGTQDLNGIDFVSTTSPVGVIADDLLDIYQLTLNAEIITMDEWINKGMPIGRHIWVVDEDGYSYWAAPLLPGYATGLLLHKVELINELQDDFYYAIHVDAHMATIDDSPDNYEKFLVDASENAGLLVNRLADTIRQAEQTSDDDPVFTLDDIMALEKYVFVEDGSFILDIETAMSDGVCEDLLSLQQNGFDILNRRAMDDKIVINEDLTITDRTVELSGVWFGCPNRGCRGGRTTSPRNFWWGFDRLICDCQTRRLVSEVSRFRDGSTGIGLFALAFGKTPPGVAAGAVALHIQIFQSELERANFGGRGVYLSMSWSTAFFVRSQ